MKRCVALFALVLVSLAAQAQPGSTPKVPRVRESMLVSTEWLAKRLNDPKIVILHVSASASDYVAGHIPGARFLALERIAVTRNDVPNELPPIEDLKKALEAVGVQDGHRVVLYGEHANLYAARAWFTLDYLGHGSSAALLDGSLQKWRAEGRPVSTEVPQVKPGKFTPRVRPEVLKDFVAVRSLSVQASGAGASRTKLLDARPPDDYIGAKGSNGIPRPGHIPGAANLFWMDTLESQNNPQLKPPAELRKMFEAAGAAPGTKVVTYCRSGVQSSHLYFTAKYLGYDTSMYDGSFQEWSKHPEAPVETGKK